MGGQKPLTMTRLKLNLIILGQILVSNTEDRSIIFHHAQGKSELINFTKDSGQQYCGEVNHLSPYPG